MTIESRAAFARRLNVYKSTVSRAADAGRLVLTPDGQVEVESSLTRWHQTSGARDDVAARHAEQRGAEIPQGGQGGDRVLAPFVGGTKDVQGAPKPGSESRAEAQTRKETAAANLMEMELEQQRKNLIPREDVDAALKSFAASTRARLDVLADQLAPVLAPVTTLDEVHALLAEHGRAILASIADDLQRAETALVRGQGA